jgi:hypothetical protein
MLNLAANPADQTLVSQHSLHILVLTMRRSRLRGHADEKAKRADPAQHGREITVFYMRSQINKAS